MAGDFNITLEKWDKTFGLLVYKNSKNKLPMKELALIDIWRIQRLYKYKFMCYQKCRKVMCRLAMFLVSTKLDEELHYADCRQIFGNINFL